MSVVADNAVHLNVIPRARARSDRLRRGLNDGAAVLLARSEGGGIRRRQRVPVNWTIDDAEFLVDLHAQFAVDVVANVGGSKIPSKEEKSEFSMRSSPTFQRTRLPRSLSTQISLDSRVRPLTVSKRIHLAGRPKRVAGVTEWMVSDLSIARLGAASGRQVRESRAVEAGIRPERSCWGNEY